MNYAEEQESAKDFFEQCYKLLVTKAHDYAQAEDCFSNFKTISAVCNIPVETTFLQFLAVKIARLSELVAKEKQTNHESLTDTLRDLSNYACLMAIYLESKDG